MTLVATLALSYILEAVVSMVWGVQVRALGSSSESLDLGGVFITSLQIGIIFASLAVTACGLGLLHGTRLGRSVRALSSNHEAASALGINFSLVASGIVVVSVVLAVLAGVLYGFDTNLHPNMGTPLMVKAFAATVLGGIGNFGGVILASYFIGMVENLGIGVEIFGVSIPSGYKDAFSFALILLVLLRRPDGLRGFISRRV